MMISSSIMIEKQAMKIEKYSHKKSRFCLIQKKLDKHRNMVSIIDIGGLTGRRIVGGDRVSRIVDEEFFSCFIVLS